MIAAGRGETGGRSRGGGGVARYAERLHAVGSLEVDLGLALHVCPVACSDAALNKVAVPVRLRKRADEGLGAEDRQARARRLGYVTSLPRVCINPQPGDVACQRLSGVASEEQGHVCCLASPQPCHLSRA
jgi:hypothetical protein